jgi:hypothetical protein
MSDAPTVPAARPNRPRVLLYREGGELVLDVRRTFTLSIGWGVGSLWLGDDLHGGRGIGWLLDLRNCVTRL